MRVNEPITDREVEMTEGQLLVSQTDAGGKIVFVNQAFIEISGFSEGELVGQPHNLVRHPHMPKEAFRDLWKTIQSGQPWEGLVKNRTKQGAFYWVRANVTPVIEDGKLAGFISIRTKPSREDIKAADAAYTKIRTGADKSLTVIDGNAVRLGIKRRLTAPFHTLAGRMAMMGVTVVLVPGLIAGYGLRNLNTANNEIHSLYVDRVQPLVQLDRISEFFQDDVLQLNVAIDNIEKGKPVGDLAGTLAKNHEAAQKEWDAYIVTYLTPEETNLAKEFAAERDAMLQLTPEAVKIAAAGDASALNAHVTDKLKPQFDKVDAGITALKQLQVDVSKEIYDEAEADYTLHFAVSLGLSALTIAILGISFWLFGRSINRPLRQFAGDFDAISRAEAGYDIKAIGVLEFDRLVTRLRALRAKLSYGAEERRVLDARSADDRSASLHGMAGTIRKEINDAVQSVSKLTGEMMENAGEMSGSATTVSDRSQAVAAAATQALANVQTVASASEELSASIGEIANQVNSAKQVTTQSVDAATTAQDIIGKLSDAVGRISQVTSLISDIAGQTNLLALNATIEAARAGEAGKGFAVVAGEVKALATQTSRATSEISSQIAEVQSATDSAVAAVKTIAEAIRGVEAISTAIAAAIDEQSATTAEIARNVTQTSIAAQEVAARISEVSAESSKTGSRAESVRSLSSQVAESVSKVSVALDGVVKSSLHEIERRRKPRYGMRVPGRVLMGQSIADMIVENLSEGGALLRGAAPEASRGQRVEVKIEGIADPLPCEVRNRRDDALHVKFDLTAAMQARFMEQFNRVIQGKKELGQAA